MAALILSSICTALLIRTRPERNYVELKLRIQTWWWMVALMFFALAFSRVIAIVSIAIVSFMAFKEFLSIVPTRRNDHSVLLLAYLSIPVQYAWVGMEWDSGASLHLSLPVRPARATCRCRGLFFQDTFPEVVFN